MTRTLYGSMGGLHLNAPIVGIAAAPTGGGYWLVASDGGVFGFGDATFYGSLGGAHLNAPIVGIAAAPTGGGYWLVASDGGVFGFGDATYRGSMGNADLDSPIVGFTTTPNGSGYRMVDGDGKHFLVRSNLLRQLRCRPAASTNQRRCPKCRRERLLPRRRLRGRLRLRRRPVPRQRREPGHLALLSCAHMSAIAGMTSLPITSRGVSSETRARVPETA